jgi:hypothetical protein
MAGLVFSSIHRTSQHHGHVTPVDCPAPDAFAVPMRCAHVDTITGVVRCCPFLMYTTRGDDAQVRITPQVLFDMLVSLERSSLTTRSGCQLAKSEGLRGGATPF